MPTSTRPRTLQLTASTGAAIEGIDVREASDADVSAIRAAVLRHRVVFLPGQQLDATDLGSFASRFGALGRSPLDALLGRTATTSVIEDTADRPPAGFDWHTDLSWTPRPPSMGFLHALAIPPFGGDTLWSNQVAAFESLPAATQEQCRALWAEHRCDPTLLATVERHHGTAVAARLRAAHPPVRHPLVRVHAETGEAGLFLSPMYLQDLVGLDRRTGAGLRRRLGEALENPHHQVRWRWSEGDLAIWDETTTCHRALVDHFPHRRLMRRCVVEGSTLRPAA